MNGYVKNILHRIALHVKQTDYENFKMLAISVTAHFAAVPEGVATRPRRKTRAGLPDGCSLIRGVPDGPESRYKTGPCAGTRKWHHSWLFGGGP